jgi:hypothetical protein
MTMLREGTNRCNGPACKACGAVMRMSRIEPRPIKEAAAVLRVFVCGDCGLYQFVRWPAPTKQTAA